MIFQALIERCTLPSVNPLSLVASVTCIDAFIPSSRSSSRRSRNDCLHHFKSRLYTTRVSLDDIFDDPYEDNKQESIMKNSETTSIFTSTSSSTRRVRYNGKYPRNFGEKYKELSGDEATVQKVLNKGMTPAGRHVPILLNECLHYLGLIDTTTLEPVFYVDCTLGYGGHSSQVLMRLLDDGNSQHKMICFDRDPMEIVKATERLQQIVHTHNSSQFNTSIVTTVNRNFREVKSYLETTERGGSSTVTAILADLGLSSMQIDNAARGFTYKREGPLDMRMTGNHHDQNTTESAYDLLSRLTVKQFTNMLKENSDETYAEIIAQAVLGSNSKKKPRQTKIPTTTIELATIVRDAVRPLLSPPPPSSPHKPTNNDPIRRDSASVKKELDATVARVMQAIRIEVNEEFESLEELLDNLPYLLAPGGRVVVLTFHSGEDRRVKQAFKTGFKDSIYSSWSRDVVRPSSEERRNNPRSSCCKLRWAIRSDKCIPPKPTRN